MKTLEFKEGIPIPNVSAHKGNKNKRKYNYEDMQIGHAVEFQTEREFKNFTNAFRQWARWQNNGAKITTRNTSKIDELYKVWRTA